MRLSFENILIISYGNINRLNNCYLIQRTGNVYRKDDNYFFISTVFILKFNSPNMKEQIIISAAFQLDS